MSAQEKYDEFTEGCEPLSPVEALRFFCSLTMHGQDWLDVEKFFDAIEAELSATQKKLEAAEARIRTSQEPYGWFDTECNQMFFAHHERKPDTEIALYTIPAPQPETDRGSNE